MLIWHVAGEGCRFSHSLQPHVFLYSSENNGAQAHRAARGPMRHLVAFALFLACLISASPSVQAAGETAASNSEWKEAESAAAIFADNWLKILDLGRFSAAAASYTPRYGDSDTAAIQTQMQSLRAECGELVSRSLYDVSTPDGREKGAEYRVWVTFHTQFTRKETAEVVEVLVVGKKPLKVIAYRLAPTMQVPDPGMPLR